ncbi:isocitrate lyase/PEP mutase family protein [Xinfangfangia sp. CPCC 101601]|uniref:Isocitrate lyase/PEP mutase family protein n=1 Tax=Pseudogemmobacter lacusdianii TaxID=3069608 RepID=A0ABU0W1N5_9RHOB|nr:isocitrate lyase/PEP mutase family protein [Xinfangfangia sp. CPCC 101601]MDQ2067931.1 isocitrate lyase/PEP mutase family protein [Xinfangfangia sp. CPCC 101601]
MTKMTAALRQLIKTSDFLVSPGVYDGYSARLAEAAGFASACTSGAAIANSLLGVEDLGFMGLSENVAHCRNLARAISIPLTADADNGYGNPVNVHFTVQRFEEAGVAGVNLEDQVSPKRCGHMPGKNVVSCDEMVKKVEAACLARRDDDFVIIARTDSLALEGIEGAVARVKAYVAAGADMIFPDAVKSREQIARIVEAAGDVPVTVNMGFGIRSRPTTPLFSIPELKSLGVKRVSLPRMLPAASIKAMTLVLKEMKTVIETGVPVDRPDLLASIEDIWSLMGFDEAQELERKLLTTAERSERYGEQ